MLLQRFVNSTVLWSWILNLLRLASGLILLPLVLRLFTTEDLGMYYVLLSLAALAPIVDFGFGPTIDRFVSYAMGGAETIEAHGVPKPGTSKDPNYPLLWQLLATTRSLYRWMTLALFVILGIWGTYSVELRINETSSPLITRLAWATTLAATLVDIYSNWWCIFLRGLNEVRAAARIGAMAMAVRCVIAVALLLAGAGLLSLPIAGMASSYIQRYFARRRCLMLLKASPPENKADLKKTFRILWPNSWRLGVQMMSGYLTINANTNICLHAFGLAGNAKYGLSVQLIGIAVTMAYVWTLTKWPIINQYRTRREHSLMQQVLWPRIWLQTFTYFGLAGAVVLCGPILLQWEGSGKEMLPLTWMLLLMLGGFLDLQFTTWGTLISTENRLPYLWPTVATNVLSLALSLTLVNYTSLGLGGLVLGPLLAGCVFNYWYWPPHAARGMKTTLFRFLFLGPVRSIPNSRVASPGNHAGG